FRRLSVFAGGATLETVEALCCGEQDADAGQLLPLRTLVEHYLVRCAEGADGAMRITMLETIREYAGEQLDIAGEREAMARAHARYYAALVTEAEPGLARGQQGLWLDRLEQERDNLRAALRWSRQAGGDRALGVQMAAALWRFWYRRGYLTEGRRWLEMALAWAGTATAERARVLLAAGNLALAQGDDERADAWHAESLAISRRLND